MRRLRGWRQNTWLLSGLPRSGTSLCCRLVGDLPDAVALTEPMDVTLLAGANAAQACRRIHKFARAVRVRILEEGRAPSRHVGGRLVDNLYGDPVGHALRRARSQRGDIDIDPPASPRFTLLIKQNAMFAALLPRLRRAFPCLGIVRNPLAVLASWTTVDMAVRNGRLPMGERFDSSLAATLESEPKALARRIAVLNWFFQQYQAHLQPDRILRYEDVVESGGHVLHHALGIHGQPSEPLLVSHNTNALYDGDIAKVLATLLRTGGAWTEFYSPEDCRGIANSIRTLR